MTSRAATLVAALAITTLACQDQSTAPHTLQRTAGTAGDRLTGDTPNYNLEILLHPVDPGAGFGHVKFRQAGNDEVQRIDLGVWVRDLAPNTEHLLQRAVDQNFDGNCTSTSWLTLGKGLVPQSILTDEKGTGTEDLFRVVPNAAGSTFEIYMRIVRKDAPTVPVLVSDCYQYSVK